MTFDMGRQPKRSPLRPVSRKRQAENKIRRANVIGKWGQNPPCLGCLPLRLIGIDRARTGCNGLADDAHEILARSRGGSITDTDNIVPLSRACHDFVTVNPDIAEAAGLSVSRRPDFPRAVP